MQAALTVTGHRHSCVVLTDHVKPVTDFDGVIAKLKSGLPAAMPHEVVRDRQQALARARAWAGPAGVVVLAGDRSSTGLPLVIRERGQDRWNVDMNIARTFRLRESMDFMFTAAFFNMFNHVQFTDPSFSLTALQNFGVITAQQNQPRRVEIGLHFVF